MNKIVKNFGSYFNDFQVGNTIIHSRTKTILESDNNIFSLITMNHHPVHLDVEYCKKEQHGKILVVGTLVFSLAVGLTVDDISGKAIANLGYENITHDAPVFLNDTINVETTILDKRESQSKNNRGIVTVKTNVFNQNDIKVMSFKRKVLVKK